MDDRYIRQLPLLGTDTQKQLRNVRVLVLGCGGLGGHLIEHLVRFGVGHITAVDGDVFTESNLNRQLLCDMNTLGTYKAEAAARRAAMIDPDCCANAVCEWFDTSNADRLIEGHDLVLDALDNVPARLLMEDVCTCHGIPIVHGAIDGWCAQVAVVMPGSGMLRRLYECMYSPPQVSSSISCTPAFCASIQAAEALKLLSGQDSALKNKLLVFDLETMEQEFLNV